MRCMLQELSDVTDPGTLEKLYSEGHDAADFLTQNVVQAELNDRGNYGEALADACQNRALLQDTMHMLVVEDDESSKASNVP